MISRLRIMTALFLIINILMVSAVSASVTHLADPHYSVEQSIFHSHIDHGHHHENVDHEHHLHVHLVADLVSFTLISQVRATEAITKNTTAQLVMLYYSPLLPPPNA